MIVHKICFIWAKLSMSRGFTKGVSVVVVYL